MLHKFLCVANVSVYLYNLPSCLPFTFFLWSSICFARREIFKQNFHSRQVNTLGIFITLSQKIICRLQSRGFGDCIGFRYMNESIFKNNIHHLKQKKSRNSKRIHTVSVLFWLQSHVDWNNKKSNLQIVMRLPKHSTEVSTHLRS